MTKRPPALHVRPRVVRRLCWRLAAHDRAAQRQAIFGTIGVAANLDQPSLIGPPICYCLIGLVHAVVVAGECAGAKASGPRCRSRRLQLPEAPVPAPPTADKPRPVDSRDLFEILTREHIDSVRAFLLGSLRDSVAAEDILQETFLVAWRILDRYDRKLPFGPWVRGIAAKLVLNWRRKLGRSRVHFCDDEVLSRMDQGFREFAQLKGDTFDEKLDALRECLQHLTGPQRESIRLHYEHGIHCKEIASRLGIGFEAVKKHLQRGRSQLHRCLQAKLPEGEIA